jgi:putative 4-mercaptohistidine N1-methyltranferase
MSSIYESPTLVEQYLLFHYGSAEEILPYPCGPIDALNFPVRIVTRFIDRHSGSMGRALDLGCAVGRSSFELSKYFDRVVGIDKSESFIRAAETLRRGGSLEYRRLDEAPHYTGLTATPPPGARPERIAFSAGDALDLPPGIGRFDLVLAANLIDRVSDPALLLEKLTHLLAPSGTLILTSPYTWLEDFTPPEKWLSNSSGPTGSLAAIQSILAPALLLLHSEDLPFLIREHARKYQWSAAQASVWRLAA